MGYELFSLIAAIIILRDDFFESVCEIGLNLPLGYIYSKALCFAEVIQYYVNCYQWYIYYIKILPIHACWSTILS